jgi:large subunit ribosomal protein L28
MKRRLRGLFAGKHIQFGNNVSHSKRRTRRQWKPNVQNKRLWSVALNDWIEFRVTTKALRCIDKAGGIDNYLLSNTRADIDSVAGKVARERVKAALRGAAVPKKEAFDRRDICNTRQRMALSKPTGRAHRRHVHPQVPVGETKLFGM